MFTFIGHAQQLAQAQNVRTITVVSVNVPMYLHKVPLTPSLKVTMAGRPIKRSFSGPQSKRNSTDVVIVPPKPASTLFNTSNHNRFSFGTGAMHRTSGPVGFELDNAEWEKKVMNSWPKKCTFVVREILQTERAYIASLEEIILGYMMPLHGYLISQGEGPNFIHTVFSNVNKLRQLHVQLLTDLHSACGDPHEFAEVFIDTCFGLYREYCTHYTDANLSLQKSMEENERLKLFITQCQHDLDHPLPLHAHLIKPVQRILKYQLMLHEMLRYMDKEDVVYPDVKMALDKMKTVAEEINTSFKKEESDETANPADIARKRCKEIKYLQRSRSGQRRVIVPDETSEMQRSLEFEDSLTLLRANKHQPNHFKTIGSRTMKGHRPLTNLIGFFDLPKSAQGFSGSSSPPPNTHSPSPKHTTPIPNSPTKSTPVNRSPSPDLEEFVNIPHPVTSKSESTVSTDNSLTVTSPESSKKSPMIPYIRKQGLTLQKSAPIVRRSTAEAQGEKGDRNSLCHNSALSHLLESQAPVEKINPPSDNEVELPSGMSKPEVPHVIPTQSHSPPAHSEISKRPKIPSKPAILPDMPLLGHTAHRRGRDRTTRPRRVIPPPLPMKPAIEMEKFVIDVSNGDPVVSLPLALQQQVQEPPSPPAATFYPSMLKPNKNSTGIRSSVLARQERMIEEMIKGGSGFRQTTKQYSTPTSPNRDSATFKNSTAQHSNRKVPLLPPSTIKQKTLPNPNSPKTGIRNSLSMESFM